MAFGPDSGVKTFAANDDICGPIQASTGTLHMYTGAVASDPLTLMLSPDKTTFYDVVDKVNGDATSGKFTSSTTGVINVNSVPGSWYQLKLKAADHAGAGNGTGRIWN